MSLFHRNYPGPIQFMSCDDMCMCKCLSIPPPLPQEKSKPNVLGDTQHGGKVYKSMQTKHK